MREPDGGQKRLVSNGNGYRPRYPEWLRVLGHYADGAGQLCLPSAVADSAILEVESEADGVGLIDLRLFPSHEH